ncbi:hypothetical protein CONLIGDRAFT_683543 [Coniochaeta ligniaria NRRL 30616]|uniref:Uncharacterized protein n=1 Tax=Coniochaeta ligniaria NRRL 30616 TaxID=1408157 RepID=A0A1J7IH33_9PEZI|nr:hypothetical protein CONLIGDRAFT_683543 [Coniochaeta ligniaria NRRL 30616]
MAGPKAPIGSLSAHSTKSANLARSVSASKFGAPSNAAAKRANLKEESESDSSDSDSDTSDADNIDHDKVLREINSKSSGAKSKVEAKAPAPAAKKPTIKNETSPANAKSKKAIVKKEESSSEEEESSEAESESEDESSSESDDEEKAAEPSKGAKLEKKAATSSDKSTSKNVKKAESEDESDSESSSSTSSSESESESEEEEAKPEKKVVAKSNDAKAKSKAETSSSSEASESEAESSDSESEEADESMAIDQRNGNNALSRIPEVVSNEFHLRKAEDGTNAADVAKFFTEAQKEGKQIWYFTAPASIPIEVVEKLEIPLERAQKGKSILSHQGDDYGVAFEDAATSRAIKLLIPSKAGDQYQLLNAPIAQTMHLKRVTQFSQDGESTLSLTQTSHTSTARPPRPQPKGLKARFQPIGVTNGSPGKIGADASDEDVDMTEAPALPSSQKTPAKKSKGTTTDKKRKLDAVTEATPMRGADTPESSKKSKKARVEPKPTPRAKSEAPSTAAAKVTPIVPPVVPSIRRESSSQAPPASTPSSSNTTKAKAVPASQPTPISKPAEPTSSAVKKESKVPLPSPSKRASSSLPSQPKEVAKTNGKVKKEKKTKVIVKAEPGTEAPKKTTPVPVPSIPTP